MCMISLNIFKILWGTIAGSSSKVQLGNLQIGDVSKEGSKTRIKVISPSGHQAERLLHEINSKAKVYKIVARKKVHVEGSPKVSAENVDYGRNGGPNGNPNRAKINIDSPGKKKRRRGRQNSSERLVCGFNCSSILSSLQHLLFM